MGSDISRVCFVGIYGHNQDEVLRQGLERRGISLSEVRVPQRSLSEAKAERRLPVRTMRATMNWFDDAPGWLFPFLVVATLLVHTVVTTAAVLGNLGDLRRADVIVVPHMGDTSVFVAKPFAVLFDTPLVYFSHNGLYFTLVRNRGIYPEDSVAGKFLFALDLLVQRLSDRVVVFSQESADRFSEAFGLPAETYEVMYIKVVESNFDTSIEPAPEFESDVLYWGNFLPHHGPDTMVEAAAALPDAEFVFVGESDKRQGVVDHADRLGAENVSFPGFVSLSELVQYIKGARVVLGPMGDNPQTEFTIGTKVAEASYLGKAIAVADQPGTSEVFDHRETAYLVEPGDAGALAAGVEEILGDDDLRHRLEDGAADVYRRHFSVDRAGERFVEIAASAR
ncbi:glycosyltransferase family 4 protein [Halogeometricum sp. CBA1124]|uniref:glycosyltransferase family 4 protein n=1 Tax=Halogeometricum sp. CBA1124 TaxID=2668071 RepID=UPI001429C443|nr:glycosyltransferase family 4 protein [Halogeometricum sp. CBA1124]MUV56107.1 glycosyltransferase [Halogeometricum sp. CBA1124]